MAELKELKRTSSHLKNALQVRVGNDRHGNPVLIQDKITRPILRVRIKGIWKELTA